MGLNGRFGKLLGRSARTGTLAADQERAQKIHGRADDETNDAQARTRQRMEAELDAQRSARTKNE